MQNRPVKLNPIAIATSDEHILDKKAKKQLFHLENERRKHDLI